MYRIFLVEDDETIAKLVRRHLEKWDYDVHVVQKFDAVMSEFASFDPHLVLMDIGLPFYNGYHWCTEIRRVSKVPVVFLSSAADNMNIVMAVSMGADDFIAKPFDLDVLTVKIQAIIRRCYDFGANNSVLEHNGAMLNISDATITYDDKRLELTKNELKILQTLFDNKERIVSRSLLMEKLWESDAYVDENTLSVNVNRLRKKLDSIGLESFIVTKKGLGLLMSDDEQSQCGIADMNGGNISTAGLNVVELNDAAKQKAVFKELSDNVGSFEDELFRIEEYVSMALQYQRVSNTENDFVLEKVSLDGVIRDTIKKYAKTMIRRHIGINYSGTKKQVYTDEKWLAFILEQILSNAIKYTPQGYVTIETAEEKDRFFITIKDTGIGIKAEDLPRVFEKGYTGYNGHADKKATGIGLYLCRQMADKLGHTIRMESELGKGTKVWIGFDLDYADTRD